MSRTRLSLCYLCSKLVGSVGRFYCPGALDANKLIKHESLHLNWFESKGLSSGVVEGFNNKAKLTMRKAYGFKQFATIEVALYHQLAKLPEPKSTHKFC